VVERFSDANISQAMVEDGLAARIDREKHDGLALQKIGPGGAVHPGMLKCDGHGIDECG
jgi:hypothetical protein